MNPASERFWSLIFILIFLPTVNSAFYNTGTLCQNILTNYKLSKEKSKLEKEKTALQGKIKEYKSSSGLKRAIKEEINLVEKNEILIKIVES